MLNSAPPSRHHLAEELGTDAEPHWLDEQPASLPEGAGIIVSTLAGLAVWLVIVIVMLATHSGGRA